MRRRCQPLRTQAPGSPMLRYTKGVERPSIEIAQAGNVVEPYAMTTSTELARCRNALSVLNPRRFSPSRGTSSADEPAVGASATTSATTPTELNSAASWTPSNSAPRRRSDAITISTLVALATVRTAPRRPCRAASHRAAASRRRTPTAR